MQIAAGTRLGPYEILSRIGAGGMGEVFRARDTRLDRIVAIKVLADDFAANPQLRLRFEREARAISKLNHPHICTLHDVGESYLVMELLEGETVADRIARGPLPIREVMRYGAQIADALDGAHKAGIVHRDLKPGNVMLTRSGAKLLDFGLAKPVQATVEVDATTQHKPITHEGTIVGTFQYMAPEQLEGGAADARTDIFALGALLYEMATGKRAFEGKTKTSLIAAIVAGEPAPISQMQPLAPPAFGHVVSRCLAKDPEERWQSAHDVAEQLRWLAEAGSIPAMPIPPGTSSRGRRNLFILGIGSAVLATAIAIGAAMVAREVRQARRPVTSDIIPAEDVTLGNASLGSLALSPDGSRLAYVTIRPGTTGLWLRDLATGASRLLEHAGECLFPFWSPEGTAIGCFDRGKLIIVDAASGSVRAVCDAPQGRGGAWSSRGVIVFAPNIRGPLFRVDAGGGRPSPVTAVNGPDISHRNPLFLPDGRHVLYVERSASQNVGSLVAASLDDPKVRKVVQANASNAAFADGMLLYRFGESLVAQPFDPKALTLGGTPATITDGIDYYNARDLASFSASTEGRLVFRRARRVSTRIVVLDSDGRELKAIGDPADYDPRYATVSADSRFLLVARREGAERRGDLWLADLHRGTLSRLTFADSQAGFAGAISPDGKRIVVSQFGATSRVTIRAFDGTASERDVLSGSVPVAALAWSRDGRSLIGIKQSPDTGWDVILIDPESGRVTPIAVTPFTESAPVLSPNGRWMLYASDETGRMDSYVTPFPAGGRKWPVSTVPATGAFWSPRGDAIHFYSGGKLHAAGVRETPAGLEFDAPKEVPIDRGSFEAIMPMSNGSWVAFKVTSDQRPEPIRLIVNWPELVR